MGGGHTPGQFGWVGGPSLAGAAGCRPLARGRPLTQRAPGESVGHTGESACPLKETGGNPPATTRRLCYHLGAATGGRCCVPMAAGQPQHACLARASRRSGPPDRPGRPSHPIARVPTSRSSDKELSDYSPRRAPKPYPGCRPSTAAAAAPPVASTPLPRARPSSKHSKLFSS